jgi:hypothetical protein
MRLILRISQPCSGPGRVLGRRICYEEHSRGNDPFDTFPVVTCCNFSGMAILIVYYKVVHCGMSNRKIGNGNAKGKYRDPSLHSG